MPFFTVKEEGRDKGRKKIRTRTYRFCPFQIQFVGCVVPNKILPVKYCLMVSSILALVLMVICLGGAILRLLNILICNKYGW